MSITFSKTVKTRKDRPCYGCCETIPKGTLTELSWGHNGDCWWRSYLCKPCLGYIAEHREFYNEGIYEGAIRQDRVDYD